MSRTELGLDIRWKLLPRAVASNRYSLPIFTIIFIYTTTITSIHINLCFPQDIGYFLI